MESFGKLEEKKKDLSAEIQAIDNAMDEEGRISVVLTERKNELLANMEVVLRCEDIH